MKKRSVTVMLTNRCNLNCIYCYETNKENKEIELNTALKIIGQELSCNDGYDSIEFNLFGGEPFLRFDLIQSIYDYLDSNPYKKNWTIGLITNGTVLSNEIKDWLREHKKNVFCTLSIDGNKEMQDRNRNNSFDLIDIDFFVSTYQLPYAKMTVSEYTVDSLCDGILYLQNKGFYVNCGVAYGIEATEYFLKELSLQLDMYFEHMKKEEYAEKSSLLRFPYESIYMGKGKYYRSCDAGTVAKAYDIDGKIYPCYMFLPVSISTKQAKNIDDIVFPDLEVNEKNIPCQCKECRIYSVCNNCYCNNYKINGNIYIPDTNVCQTSKLIIRKKAEFFAYLWNENKLELSQRQEKMLVDSILLILKEV